MNMKKAFLLYLQEMKTEIERDGLIPSLDEAIHRTEVMLDADRQLHEDKGTDI